MTLPVRTRLAQALGVILAWTRLQYWPVRIRHGFLHGCRWTLWPHSAYWRGHYEPEVQAALSRHAPAEGDSAWDLGAHFGFYTLWLGRAVGPAGQVCAFEPDWVSFTRLRRHLAMNRFDHVHAYNLAASDTGGEQRLIQTSGAGATTSHLPYPDEAAGDRPAVTVRTVTLDELAARDGLSPPQFIKIDIEGHAAFALRGARQVIAGHRPTLFVSMHSPDETDGVRAVLQPYGYTAFALDGTPIAWRETLFHTVVLKT
jgi:FkbM family methyltransferase